MTAAAFRFPSSFLKNSVFIFKGETADDLICDFNSVQNLEQHTMNVMRHINWVTNKEEYNFADDFYGKWYRQEDLTFDDVKKYFSLVPSVCTMLDIVTDENAIEILKEKYPGALCR